MRLISTLVLALVVHQAAGAWYYTLNLTDDNFYCWPEDSPHNHMPFPTCVGVDFTWLNPPPHQVTTDQQPWNTTFQLTLEPGFFTWAVKDINDGFKKNLFQKVNDTLDITEGDQAEDWCQSADCPPDPDPYDCCLSTIQLHSCPLVAGELCLPWADQTSPLTTHYSTSSPGNNGTWTITLSDMDWTPGLVKFVAYIQMPGMTLAMYRNIEVVTIQTGLHSWQIAAVSSTVLLLLIVAMFILGFKVFTVQIPLRDVSWIISPKDLFPERSEIIDLFTQDGVEVIHRESEMLLGFDSSQCLVTQYNSHGTVYLKNIRQDDVQLSKQLRQEVSQVRSLDHPNICKFIGACSHPPHLYIIMEYCKRGSLSDVLLNQEIPLLWKFRLQFAHDIISGLRYLQRRRLYHGNLKSTNCLIDKYWTLKLTDFGLDALCTGADPPTPRETSSKAAKARIYLPPEYTEGVKPLAMHTVDVYAYGVILIELVNRRPPYLDHDPASLEPTWKPPIPMFDDDMKPGEDRCQNKEEYSELIHQCLNDVPRLRPSLKNVKEWVNSLLEERKTIRRLSLLETYSAQLETSIMEERTEKENEKKKLENMYNVMVPKQLTEDNQTSAGDCYQDATVYFSDIVGFTSLVAGSSPRHVVALLNQVYTRFNSVIQGFDVCVVEIIGDGYLVVSGAPCPNPRHAEELADMSLALLALCEDFPVPQRPGENLVIRIGLHSGHVYGGIVNQALPKFYVFGETVTMASKIEATSKALKIHISETTHQILNESGQYDLEERPNIPMLKGMKTWWLLGRDDSSSKLPVEAVVEIETIRECRWVSSVSEAQEYDTTDTTNTDGDTTDTSNTDGDMTDTSNTDGDMADNSNTDGDTTDTSNTDGDRSTQLEEISLNGIESTPVGMPRVDTEITGTFMAAHIKAPPPSHTVEIMCEGSA